MKRELREKLARRGHRLLAEKFFWEPLGKRLENLYEQVADARTNASQGYR